MSSYILSLLHCFFPNFPGPYTLPPRPPPLSPAPDLPSQLRPAAGSTETPARCWTQPRLPSLLDLRDQTTTPSMPRGPRGSRGRRKLWRSAGGGAAAEAEAEAGSGQRAAGLSRVSGAAGPRAAITAGFGCASCGRGAQS